MRLTTDRLIVEVRERGEEVPREGERADADGTEDNGEEEDDNDDDEESSWVLIKVTERGSKVVAAVWLSIPAPTVEEVEGDGWRDDAEVIRVNRCGGGTTVTAVS